VRMLDNVLDVTVWPLPQQHDEARRKRRVGLGFTGLGDALAMLGLRYDTPEALAMARRIAQTLRDAAYDASIELARERGAFAPFIDTSISKTVNVPADYPYADFQNLYLEAWQSGLKGLATYRPNIVLGAVLSVQRNEAAPLQIADANRRLALDRLPAPVLSSLRWPGRPELPGGNPAWTFMVHHPFGDFALFVGELAREDGGAPQPFEVWVNGAEQPRGLGALAKTLSMDLRANDPAWLQLKLDALATVAEERAFEMPFPPHGERRLFPGVVAATAAVV